MRRGGSIVLVGSINGTKGFLTETTCSATTVVRSRCQISAAELRDRGIRVNSLSLELTTETPLFEKAFTGHAEAENLRMTVASFASLGRIGRRRSPPLSFSIQTKAGA
jgi:NAD(P)-dependent dehydrogenase (short-subunit alcohol dehydrogenase family)